MTSINRLDRTLNILRRALSERAGAKGGERASSVTPHLELASQLESTKQVRQRIKTKLTELDLKEPEHQERAATIFLETILANEWGMQIIEDPRFYDMLAEIRSIMLSDTETQKDLLQVLNEIKDLDSN